MRGQMTRRHVCFAFLVLVGLVAFYKPLWTLLVFSIDVAHYSHIIVIPGVSLALLWLERKQIFRIVSPSPGTGLIVIVLGAMLFGFAHQLSGSLSQNDYLSAAILSIVIIWIGAFILCYGVEVFRGARFPLLFLFFMVPIPDFKLGKIIFALQKGSAGLAYPLFELTGVPVFRQEFLFSLPGLDIEVAKECSGIRSSLALLISNLLAGHFFLRSAWGKLCLTLAVFPIALVKNAVRIVTISLLAIHGGRSFLTGHLHRSGGILFFLLSLILLVIVLRWLQQCENHKGLGFQSVALLKAKLLR